MGHSSLLGADHAALTPAGRDTASLGPGDSSDSGSDLAGLDELDTQDPGAPLDTGLREDQPHPLRPPDAAGGSDAAGTGERRSAASDGGAPDGSDIGVDHVFTPGGHRRGGDLPDDEDEDLAFVDQAVAGNPLDDEEEDEEEDEMAEENRKRHPRDHSPSQPPEPTRPNPEPDLPEPVPGEDDDLPIDEPDAADHRPGRMDVAPTLAGARCPPRGLLQRPG